MTAINFPINPNDGDVYAPNGTTADYWIWSQSGGYWRAVDVVVSTLNGLSGAASIIGGTASVVNVSNNQISVAIKTSGLNTNSNIVTYDTVTQSFVGQSNFSYSSSEGNLKLAGSLLLPSAGSYILFPDGTTQATATLRGNTGGTGASITGPTGPTGNRGTTGTGYTAAEIRNNYLYIQQVFSNGTTAEINLGYIGPTGSGFVFDADLVAAFAIGKSFGRYLPGETIPAVGKTAVDVIKQAMVEPLAPTVGLTTNATIQFNQTGITNGLTASYTINTLGASVSSALLEWKRSNEVAYTTLTGSTANPLYFVHTTTDTNYNTNGFNYRYTVTDSAGATAAALLTVTPAAYSGPTAAFAITAATSSSPETSTLRVLGNTSSNISATITRNSPLVPIQHYQWQFRNESGAYQNIGGTFAAPGTNPFNTGTTSHSFGFTATSANYRLAIVDGFTTTNRDSSTINLRHVIYWGKSGLSSATSINDLTTGKSRRFVASPSSLGTGLTFAFPTSTTAEFCHVIVPTSPGSPGTVSGWRDPNNITLTPIQGTFAENNEYATNIGWAWYRVQNATDSAVSFITMNPPL